MEPRHTVSRLHVCAAPGRCLAPSILLRWLARDSGRFTEARWGFHVCLVPCSCFHPGRPVTAKELPLRVFMLRGASYPGRQDWRSTIGSIQTSGNSEWCLMGGFIIHPKQPVSLSVTLSGVCGLSLSLPHIFLFSHLFSQLLLERKVLHISTPRKKIIYLISFCLPCERTKQQT